MGFLISLKENEKLDENTLSHMGVGKVEQELKISPNYISDSTTHFKPRRFPRKPKDQLGFKQAN